MGRFGRSIYRVMLISKDYYASTKINWTVHPKVMEKGSEVKLAKLCQNKKYAGRVNFHQFHSLALENFSLKYQQMLEISMVM